MFRADWLRQENAMSLFPTDPKKIRAQITRYEREMRREYETHRFIDDASGKPHLVRLSLFGSGLSGLGSWPE
jgi:hypothetical protein